MKEKFKSPVLWSTLAALIAFVSKEWIGWEIPGWDNFIVLVMAAAAAFGIVNNPDNRDGI